jgi:hypothetical protein
MSQAAAAVQADADDVARAEAGGGQIVRRLAQPALRSLQVALSSPDDATTVAFLLSARSAITEALNASCVLGVYR